MKGSMRHLGSTIPALLAVTGLALPVAAQVGGMDDDSRFGGSAGQSADYRDPGLYGQPVHDADDWTAQRTFSEDEGYFDENWDEEFQGWRGQNDGLGDDRIYGTDDEMVHDDDMVDLDADPSDGDDDWFDFDDDVSVADDQPERKDAEARHADDDFYVEERVYGIWGDYGANEDAEGAMVPDRRATVRRDDSAVRARSDQDTHRASMGHEEKSMISDRGRTYHTDIDQDRSRIGSVEVVDLRSGGEADRGGRTFGIAEEQTEARTVRTERTVEEPRTTVRTRAADMRARYPRSEYSLWAEYGSEEEPEYWAEDGFEDSRRDAGDIWYDAD